MEKAATEGAERVRSRCAGNGGRAEDARKMLFRGNEAKDLLKTRKLTFSGAQDELLFECKNAVSSEKYGRKSTSCGAFETGITLI
jgi:hypothetical protein